MIEKERRSELRTSSRERADAEMMTNKMRRKCYLNPRHAEQSKILSDR